MKEYIVNIKADFLLICEKHGIEVPDNFMEKFWVNNREYETVYNHSMGKTWLQLSYKLKGVSIPRVDETIHPGETHQSVLNQFMDSQNRNNVFSIFSKQDKQCIRGGLFKSMKVCSIYYSDENRSSAGYNPLDHHVPHLECEFHWNEGGWKGDRFFKGKLPEYK